MNKQKSKLFFLFLISFLLFQCSIKDWSDFNANPFKTKPNWNIDFDLPLLNVRKEINDFVKESEKINTTADVTFDASQGWPPSQETITIPHLIYNPHLIDFNGDKTNDFNLSQMSGKDGSVVIHATLIKDSEPPIKMAVNDIAITSFKIGSTQIVFQSSKKDEEKGIQFTSINSLEKDDLITITPEGKIKIDEFKITLNPESKPSDVTTDLDGAKLRLHVFFHFTDNWTMQGKMVSKGISLLEEKDMDLPIADSPISIYPLLLKMRVKNNLPFQFLFQGNFAHGDQEENLYDKATKEIFATIQPNKKAHKEQTFFLTTTKNVFNEKDLKLNFAITIDTTDEVTLKSDMDFTMKLDLQGTGNINLNKF